jgi:hypothetical protein
MTCAHYYRIGNSSVRPPTEGFSTRRWRKLAVPRRRFATRREFNGRKRDGGLSHDLEFHVLADGPENCLKRRDQSHQQGLRCLRVVNDPWSVQYWID